MENVTALKSERKFTKLFLSYASTLTLPQIIAWVMCFAFSRANFFGILKPFATAFYVSVNFTGLSKVLAILSITLGNALFSNFYETVRQTLALLLFEAFSRMIFQIAGRKETPLSRSTLMALLVGFTGILRGLVQGIRLYDLVVSVLCAALTFSLAALLAPAAELFKNTREKPLVSSKILVCKAILLCMAVICLEGVALWEIEIGSVFAAVAVLVIARRKGSAAGALAGALLGMILSLYDLPTSMEVPGMLALAGASAGLPVKSRTAGVSLWIVVVILFSGLTLLEGSLIIKYYEALTAGILFLLIPKTVLDFLSDGLIGMREGMEPVSDSGQAQEAADKLFVLGKALSRVSRNIEETIADESEDEASVAEWMIETVAEKVCNRCSLCERCWGTHFLKSYKLVEKTISDLKTDETGQLEIPSWFRSTCTKSDKFFEILSAAYSLYKAENIWRIKLNESRLLLSKQAALVSSGIMSTARNLLDVSSRDCELESRLLSAAGMNGIPITSVRYHNQANKAYLEAVYEAKSKFNVKNLDELVRRTVLSGFVRVGENRRDMMGYSVVRYMKQPKLKTATGIARISRESSMVSGDNFAFFISGEGYHISAISDGAGSGRRAERYSRTAIQMLENLIEDGLEISQAIRLLNLYLNLRGESERLATMDLCAVDLSSGEASFYKYGAPASYVKGKEGTVTVSVGEKGRESGPVSHFKPAVMTAGDFVVMVSDGVLEPFSEDGDTAGLQMFIEALDTVNPQQLADAILKEALERTHENHDDMTVLVTRLW